MAGHLRLGGVPGIGRPLGTGRKLLLLGTGRRASIRIARHRRGAGTRVARHRWGGRALALLGIAPTKH